MLHLLMSGDKVAAFTSVYSDVTKTVPGVTEIQRAMSKKCLVPDVTKIYHTIMLKRSSGLYTCRARRNEYNHVYYI